MTAERYILVDDDGQPALDDSDLRALASARRFAAVHANPDLLSTSGLFGGLEAGRDARDHALLKEVSLVLDPKTVRAAQDAQKVMRKAERALADALADLATIDATAPQNAADVQTWATKKRDAVNLVDAQTRYLEAATAAYATHAATVQAQLLTEIERRVAVIMRTRPKVEQTYRDMKEAARQYLATQNEEREAVNRLYDRAQGNVLAVLETL